jgi:hypothetical protein
MPRSNQHHLIWPKSQQSGIRKTLRELPCAIIKIDEEVHRALHLIYDLPSQIPTDVAQRLVDRHRDKACSCYDPRQSTPRHVLEINRDLSWE